MVPINLEYSGFVKPIFKSKVEYEGEVKFNGCLIQSLFIVFRPRRTYKFQVVSKIYELKFNPNIGEDELNMIIENFPVLYLGTIDKELIPKGPKKDEVMEISSEETGKFENLEEISKALINVYGIDETIASSINYISMG